MANFNTIPEALKYFALHCGDRPCHIFRNKDGRRHVITYSQLHRLAGHYAAVLRHKGVGKGSFVMNTLLNSPERLVGEMGILYTGAVSVNGHCHMADGSDLLRGLRQSRACVILLDPDVTCSPWLHLQRHANDISHDGIVTSQDLPDLKRVELIKRSESEGEDFLKQLETSSEWFMEDDVTGDDALTVMTTSGTTGFSKLVVHTHKNMVTFAQKFNARTDPLKTRTVWYQNSAMGWSGGYVGTFILRAVTRVICDDRAGIPEDMQAFLVHSVQEEKCNMVSVNPQGLHELHARLRQSPDSLQEETRQKKEDATKTPDQNMERAPSDAMPLFEESKESLKNEDIPMNQDGINTERTTSDKRQSRGSLEHENAIDNGEEHTAETAHDTPERTTSDKRQSRGSLEHEKAIDNGEEHTAETAHDTTERTTSDKRQSRGSLEHEKAIDNGEEHTAETAFDTKRRLEEGKESSKEANITENQEEYASQRISDKKPHLVETKGSSKKCNDTPDKGNTDLEKWDDITQQSKDIVSKEKLKTTDENGEKLRARRPRNPKEPLLWKEQLKTTEDLSDCENENKPRARRPSNPKEPLHWKEQLKTTEDPSDCENENKPRGSRPRNPKEPSLLKEQLRTTNDPQEIPNTNLLKKPLVWTEKVDVLIVLSRPIPKATLETAFTFARAVATGYASSELGPTTMHILTDKKDCNDYDTGQPLPGVEVKIVDEEDEKTTLPAGQEGQLLVKHPEGFIKYLNDAETTSIAFTEDGFFRTKDRASLTPNNHLLVFGRSGDVVLRDGIIIYTHWLESLICACPGVSDVIVTGFLDPNGLEDVCACVVLQDDVTLDRVRCYAESAFSEPRTNTLSQRPRWYLRFDEFPVLYTEKPNRKLVKEIATAKMKGLTSENGHSILTVS